MPKLPCPAGDVQEKGPDVEKGLDAEDVEKGLDEEDAEKRPDVDDVDDVERAENKNNREKYSHLVGN